MNSLTQRLDRNFNWDAPATIISIVPFPIKETKPGLIPGYFELNACKDQSSPELLYIPVCAFHVYIDEFRGSLRVEERAEKVATSIVNDYVTSQLQVSLDCRPGLFWEPGILSKDDIDPKLLAKAKGDQHNWFTALAKLADDDFSQYKKHNVVSAFQRIAAREIGWLPSQHPWMDENTAFNSPSCPYCYATLLHPDATVCATCSREIVSKEEKEEVLVAK